MWLKGIKAKKIFWSILSWRSRDQVIILVRRGDLRFIVCICIGQSNALWSNTQLRSVKACLEIFAIRNVWAAASRAIVQWKNGVCLIEDSDGSSGLSKELAFSTLVWKRGRNLCTCERLLTIAAVFYLSFLLFSVVVAGVSCFQLWEMLGQVKNIDFGVCKLLTQVVHVTLDTLLVKAPSCVDNCRFWDRIRQRECRWRIKLPTNPLDSVFCVHGANGQLRSCNSWVL